MDTETITIHVASDAARLFNAVPPDQQRKLEALLSLRLLEVVQQDESLEEVLREMSRHAQARGLTSEILVSILNGK